MYHSIFGPVQQIYRYEKKTIIKCDCYSIYKNIYFFGFTEVFLIFFEIFRCSVWQIYFIYNTFFFFIIIYYLSECIFLCTLINFNIIFIFSIFVFVYFAFIFLPILTPITSNPFLLLIPFDQHDTKSIQNTQKLFNDILIKKMNLQ